MRFSATHKATSYLMVLAAVFSLVLSPDISMLASILGLAGVALSWFAEPKRVPIHKLTTIWNIATLGFLGYLVLMVLRGESVITAGVHFLLFVLINKLFNRRSSKDYQQAYVVSFLMLVAATTLNTGLSYAVCFVLYVLFATWTLILFHLRREMEENYLLKHTGGDQSEKVEVERILSSRRIVGGRFLLGTSMLSLGILLGAVVIFTFFPRIGFGLFISHSRFGTTMVGFRDRVQLGHHGTVRDNPNVVMRVMVDSPRKLPPKLLWRGSAFDHYSAGEWSHSPDLSGRTQRVDPSPTGLYRFNHVPGVPRGAKDRWLRENLLRQLIYLEPLDSTLVFAADRPVAIEVPRRRVSGRPMFTPRRGPLGEIRGKRMRGSGVRYVAFSQIVPPSAAKLAAAPPIRSDRWRRFLQLPTTLPARVRKLAEQITARAKTVYAKVRAIQRFLQRRYRYTLELTHDPKREPVDEFLFTTRAGHCEYFASSMTLMLRSIGVHARNVNGFAGGAWNAYGRYLAVRQGDAHAWTEVLFSGIGWVAFDPTPSGAGPRRSAVTGVMSRLRQMIDALRLRWFRWVIEYDLGKQVSLLKSIGRWFSGKRGKGQRGLGSGLWARYRRTVLLGGGALLLLVALLVAWRRRRRRARDAGGPIAARPSDHSATALYQRALALLRKVGVERAADQTPRELADSLSSHADEAAPKLPADVVDRVTSAYYQARYAPDETADLGRLEVLVAELSHAISESQQQQQRQQQRSSERAS
ncbi:MAG: DUF3488 domain-containing protein [Myxococcales bacterium]|nr:DUF3488 domain-containing protein [Myxococcales bacterium]